MGAISLAVVFALAGGDPHPRFVCDANGWHFAGDTPPYQCRRVPISELNPDGSLKRVIEPRPGVEHVIEPPSPGPLQKIPNSPDLCRGDPQCGRGVGGRIEN